METRNERTLGLLMIVVGLAVVVCVVIHNEAIDRLGSSYKNEGCGFPILPR